MMGLFIIAVWRADLSAQARLLTKISEAMPEDPEKAARLLAVSWLLEPFSTADDKAQEVHILRKGLAVELESLQYTLSDTEQAILELTSNDRFQSLESANLKRLVNEDGIAPRAGFSLLDHAAKPISSAPIADEELQGFVESLSLQIATALVYGRQTDREPTLVLLGVLADDQPVIDELVRSSIKSAVESKRESNVVLIDSFCLAANLYANTAKYRTRATIRVAGNDPQTTFSDNFPEIEACGSQRKINRRFGRRSEFGGRTNRTRPLLAG